IHTGRGNAAKFVNRLCWNVNSKLDISLSEFNSGNEHKAIPRDGFATITVASKDVHSFKKYVSEFESQYKKEYGTKEPNLAIFAELTDKPSRIMTKEFQERLLNSFYAVPHGVYRMSPDIEGLVQTSTNFAIVETKDD